jgi:hypothetical protein
VPEQQQAPAPERAPASSFLPQAARAAAAIRVARTRQISSFQVFLGFFKVDTKLSVMLSQQRLAPLVRA